MKYTLENYVDKFGKLEISWIIGDCIKSHTLKESELSAAQKLRKEAYMICLDKIDKKKIINYFDSLLDKLEETPEGTSYYKKLDSKIEWLASYLSFSDKSIEDDEIIRKKIKVDTAYALGEQVYDFLYSFLIENPDKLKTSVSHVVHLIESEREACNPKESVKAGVTRIIYACADKKCRAGRLLGNFNRYISRNACK